MHEMSIHMHCHDGNAHEMMSMNDAQVHRWENKGGQSKVAQK
jgi:hypothetical protein